MVHQIATIIEARINLPNLRQRFHTLSLIPAYPALIHPSLSAYQNSSHEKRASSPFSKKILKKREHEAAIKINIVREAWRPMILLLHLNRLHSPIAAYQLVQ